jgi:hypothetical protein
MPQLTAASFKKQALQSAAKSPNFNHLHLFYASARIKDADGIFREFVTNCAIRHRLSLT